MESAPDEAAHLAKHVARHLSYDDGHCMPPGWCVYRWLGKARWCPCSRDADSPEGVQGD
jgi:hypothetical protein